MATYQIRAVVPGDIPMITELVMEAMRSDILDQTLFPAEDLTQAEQTANRRSWMQDLWSRQLFNPHAHLLVAHSPGQLDDIAGFACWHFAEPVLSIDTAAETVVADAMGDVLPRGMSRIAHDECAEKLEGVKARVLDISRACYHLTMLATNPRHARRGIGTMLFTWAVERADVEDALIYLEATPIGLGLYEEFGCKSVERVDFSRGGERVIMIRQPRVL